MEYGEEHLGRVPSWSLRLNKLIGIQIFQRLPGLNSGRRRRVLERFGRAAAGSIQVERQPWYVKDREVCIMGWKSRFRFLVKAEEQ